MLDEGENEVTIHLPESVRRLNEEAAAAGPSTEAGADPQKRMNPIRDYSMDSFNGETGMPYWGYNESNKNDAK